MALADAPARRLSTVLTRLRLASPRKTMRAPAPLRDEFSFPPDDTPVAGSFGFLAKLFLAVAIALVGGIGSAYLAIDRGRLFNAVELGQWTAYPLAGTPDADPYSAATLARTGQVPLGAGEGLAFFGERDSLGDALTGACDYTIFGETPPARLWTLNVTDSAGHLVENAAGRQSLDSRSLLREPDGSFHVTVARYARPGNWLPMGATGKAIFVLRLYDTPLTTGTGLADLAMPEIVREACQ